MHGGTCGNEHSITHGRYSKALEKHPEVRALYEQARDDPQIQETKNEIALLRAKLQHWLEAFAGDRSQKALWILEDYADAIAKLVERRHKMLHGEKVTITMEHAEAFVARVLELVREHYGDDDRYSGFLVKLNGLHRGETDGQAAEDARE
jgi:hypothetical protein